jgi:UPF0716 protein FxsA
VLRRLQEETREGRLPADPLVDGAIVLVAGALLMTPGILTDAIGFLCLVPGVRGVVKRRIREELARAVREERLRVHVTPDGPWAPRQEKEVHGVRVREEDDASSRSPTRDP